MHSATALCNAIALLLAASVAGCGSIGGPSPDTADAMSDETDTTRSDAGSLDASDASERTADAECVGDALTPGMGATFGCGTDMCFSKSQYCRLTPSGGVPLIMARIQPLDDAAVGSTCPGGATCPCQPLPCECGASPTCECLHPMPVAPSGIGNTCLTDDAGDLTLEVFLP